MRGRPGRSVTRASCPLTAPAGPSTRATRAPWTAPATERSAPSRPMAAAKARRSGVSGSAPGAGSRMLPIDSVEKPWTRPGTASMPGTGRIVASVDGWRIPAAIGAVVRGGDRLQLLAQPGDGTGRGHDPGHRGDDPGAVLTGAHGAAVALLGQVLAPLPGRRLGLEDQEGADRVRQV